MPNTHLDQRGSRVNRAPTKTVGLGGFLYIATGAVGAVGAALALWPFIDQMNPDASVRALASIEVDLAPIAAGQAITVKRGNPVFIRHRTPGDRGRAVPLDNLDTEAQQSAEGAPGDENRVVGGKESY